jgi:hypothetical protein
MSFLIPGRPIDRAAFGPLTGCSFEDVSCRASLVLVREPVATAAAPRNTSHCERLELLRRHKVRATRSPTSQQYRVQAEEYRFQAETFRDPQTQAQTLRLAEIYERKAMQAEKWGNAGEEDNGEP